MKFIAASCILWALLATTASAQLKPSKTYFGIDRPCIIEVRGRSDELAIRWISAPSGKVLATVAVSSGRVDIAQKLDLWKAKNKSVTYLQLVDGGRGIGAPLVLQPMTNPPVATLSPDGRNVKFEADEDNTYAGVRVWVDETAVFETEMGNIEVRMRPDAAPNTVWNFLSLVKGGFYDGVIFHRVVAKRPADGNPFVIQGGDPTGSGSGSPGYAFVLEDSPLPHDFGVISMARSTDPNTNGCQFFFALSRPGTMHLDHRYASFGETIKGGDVIRKIASVKTGAQDRPEKPPVIKRIRLIPAQPYGTGPKPEK